MMPGYTVKVGLDEFSGELADHFVVHGAQRVTHRDRSDPYCMRAPVGPDMKTLPHTEYAGFAETPNEALEAALCACRQDWPGIEIVHESDLRHRRQTAAT